MPISLLFIAKPLLLAMALAMLSTMALIIFFRRIAWLAPVREERWNKQPKPHYGGIAIFIGYLIPTLIFGRSQDDSLVIASGATAMFLLGLLDDCFDLKPHIKLVYEIAIATVITYLGVVVNVFSDKLLAMTATVVWIVMITNAFNLLDNMDGLSGGIAIISMLAFLMIAMINGNMALALPGAIIIGAVAGFLVFNFPPAKIFMGDGGALLVGYLLAVFAVKGSWYQASNLFLLLVTPVLLLGVPIFDTMVVSLQRLLHGRPIYVGGKDHSSHRLVALGWNERQAILILYGLAFLLGLISVISYALNIFVTTLIVSLLLVFFVSLGVFLSDVKVYQAAANDGKVKAGRYFTFSTFIAHKRRIAEIIVDCLLMVVAYLGAYLLRFDGEISLYNWQLIQQSLPIMIALKLITLLFAGMYSGDWKYVDFKQLRKIFAALTLASLVTISILVGTYRFSGFSRSIFVIDYLLFAFLAIGFRVGLRVMRESVRNQS